MTRIHFPCYLVQAERFFAVSFEINVYYNLIIQIFFKYLVLITIHHYLYFSCLTIF